MAGRLERVKSHVAQLSLVFIDKDGPNDKQDISRTRRDVYGHVQNLQVFPAVIKSHSVLL
jgi:hypothetical protein